jgi:hypothetical protein
MVSCAIEMLKWLMKHSSSCWEDNDCLDIFVNLG